MTNSSVSIAAMTASQSSHHVPNEERDGEIAKALSSLLAKDDDGNLLPEPIGSATGRDPGGILVLGPTRAGKTSAVHHVLDSMPVLTDPVTGAPRYLKVQAPNRATPKRLCLEILAATGMCLRNRNLPLWQALQAAQTRLSAQQTVVLFIDEAQNLFDARNRMAAYDMRKILHSLMSGPSGVILIMSGTEGLAAYMRNDCSDPRQSSS